MGNTQKEATVPAPARRAALRASAPRIIASTLTTACSAILSAARALRDRTAPARRTASGAASRAVSRAASLATSTTTSVAGSRAVNRAASRAASLATSTTRRLARSQTVSRAASLATSTTRRLARSQTVCQAASLATSLAGSRAVSLAAATIRSAGSACGSAIRHAAQRASRALPARTRIPVATLTVLAFAAAVTAAAIAIGPAAAAGPIGPAIAAAALRPAPAGIPGPSQVGRSAAAAVAQSAAPRSHGAAAPAAGQAVPKARTAAAPRHHRGWHHRWQAPTLDSWHAIAEAAAGHPGGGPLAPAQRLLPAPLTGGQAAMPVTPDRAANAAVITGQALRLHMGLRSAVIAVATAMQESTLENLNYGDRDSLGLFQQRPSMGWGTPAQVTDPVYASDAFLNALRAYQAADPDWATQPLWEAAQGVQQSAFPYAYAQWEDQAAHIVAAVARHLL